MTMPYQDILTCWQKSMMFGLAAFYLFYFSDEGGATFVLSIWVLSSNSATDWQETSTEIVDPFEVQIHCPTLRTWICKKANSKSGYLQWSRKKHAWG